MLTHQRIKEILGNDGFKFVMQVCEDQRDEVIRERVNRRLHWTAVQQVYDYLRKKGFKVSFRETDDGQTVYLKKDDHYTEFEDNRFCYSFSPVFWLGDDDDVYIDPDVIVTETQSIIKEFNKLSISINDKSGF